MMRQNDLEERIRDAMHGEETIPRAEMWTRVVARRTAGGRVVLPDERRHWWPRWLVVGAAAASLVLVVPLLRRQDPVQTTPAGMAKEQPTESFFIPGALLAQSSLSPAYPTLSRAVGRDIRPGQWILGQVVDGKVRERYEYRLSRSTYENQPAWLVVARYFYGSEGRRLDSIWTSPDSLSPRLRISRMEDRRIEQTFRQDDILTGTTQNGYTSWSVTPTRPHARDATSGVLQVSSMALQFQAAPLSRNWKRSLPYPAMTVHDSVVYLNLVVDGEEEIEVPAGKFTAWRIRLQIGTREPKPYDPINPPGGIYYWVSKDRQWMLKMAFMGAGGPDTPPVVLIRGEEE